MPAPDPGLAAFEAALLALARDLSLPRADRDKRLSLLADCIRAWIETLDELPAAPVLKDPATA